VKAKLWKWWRKGEQEQADGQKEMYTGTQDEKDRNRKSGVEIDGRRRMKKSVINRKKARQRIIQIMRVTKREGNREWHSVYGVEKEWFSDL
jgi:hypothetical protein